MLYISLSLSLSIYLKPIQHFNLSKIPLIRKIKKQERILIYMLELNQCRVNRVNVSGEKTCLLSFNASSIAPAQAKSLPIGSKPVSTARNAPCRFAERFT